MRDVRLKDAVAAADERTRVETLIVSGATGDPAHTGAVLLPGRYEDLGVIGGGAFGEVRRARDTLFDRVVAMKLLRPQLAGIPHVRRRFIVEATITAQLQHPGIVAVFDRGELPDGRLWYAMKAVQGRTLNEVLAELHAYKTRVGFPAAPSGWTFRRLVDAFARIAQAVAFAHSRGVVHRDLKPDNIMVGEFGEVLVMDWGLARAAGGELDGGGPMPAPSDDAGSTRQGDILGTPAFMAPEQARGDTALHGPATDIYALGAVLHCVLTGFPPHGGSPAQVFEALLSGEPVRVADAAFGGPPLPVELVTICERALRPAIADRYPSADALAADVVAWLDGVRRREQALSALQQARALTPEIEDLRAKAAAREREARALQADLRPFDPVEKKRPVWSLLAEAARLARSAALIETRWTEAVHGALSLDPDSPEAHAMLADHHRERLLSAELARRDEDAARAEEMLRIHDRGAHAAFLRGEGSLTLVTDPPGAVVHVDRFVLHDQRLIPSPEGALGVTPLCEVSLSRGSYRLRISAEGRAEVHYPVLIERAGHFDGRAPGDERPCPIPLPPAGEIDDDEVYVPPGYAWIGGDPQAADALPRRRVWVDGFIMGRFPVTSAEYLSFVNDLVRRGRVEEAIRACPRRLNAAERTDATPMFLRGEDGMFALPPDRPPGLPVGFVDWHGARAYTAWLSERRGRPYRLPDELEWEKAARGVDGRIAPWGDHLDATFACVVESHRGVPAPSLVDSYPEDESPYGVRGLGGNMRDWCANAWRLLGPPVEEGRLRIEEASPDDDDYRIVRGGTWGGTLEQARSASRFGSRPSQCWHGVGLRVVRSWGGR